MLWIWWCLQQPREHKIHSKVFIGLFLSFCFTLPLQQHNTASSMLLSSVSAWRARAECDNVIDANKRTYKRKISASTSHKSPLSSAKTCIILSVTPSFYVVFYGPTMPHELCSMYNKISEFFVLIVLLCASRTSKNLSCMPVSQCSTLHTLAIFKHPLIEIYAKVTCLRKQ